MKIVRRRESDWPALLDLWVASWSATYPAIDFSARRDWLVRHINDLEARGAATLCLVDGEETPAGFVVINPNDGWLDQICVAPAHCGAGVGAKLLEAAAQAAPRGVRLDVTADNARAIRFYERNGFARVGEGGLSMSGRPTLIMERRANP